FLLTLPIYICIIGIWIKYSVIEAIGLKIISTYMVGKFAAKTLLNDDNENSFLTPGIPLGLTRNDIETSTVQYYDMLDEDGYNVKEMIGGKKEKIGQMEDEVLINTYNKL